MQASTDGVLNTGRAFFALGLVAFGVLQFFHGDFVAGRAPAWPATLSGRLPWAWTTGVLFVVAGSCILANARAARTAALLVGITIFGWAFLRHLPGLVSSPGGAALTAAGKALALTGGALAVASSLSPRSGGSWRLLDPAGRFGLGVFMVLAGVQHFVYASFVAGLVPVWIPGALVWTCLTGVALIAGGVGLFLRPTRRRAALLSGLMILSWVVLLHLPRAWSAGPAESRNEWTALFEALAFAGTAFVLAGRERSDNDA